MAKTELGTKRVCPETGRKFYDLGKTPVISPYTGKVVPIVAPAPSRARPEAPVAAARPAPAPEPEVVVPETQEAEFVSLEDAEAEQHRAQHYVILDRHQIHPPRRDAGVMNRVLPERPLRAAPPESGWR